MEIKVYIDTLFFTNLIMDYALLYLSAKIIRRKIRTSRLILASVLGALYGVFSFFMPVFPHVGNFLKIAVGLVMVLITFRPAGIISFIKCSCIFFTACFCLGGSAFSLLYHTNLGSLIGTVISDGTIYLNIPIYKLFFVCAACYGVLTVFNNTVKKYRKNSDLISDVTLFYDGKSITMKALHDSGNSLTEPVSGLSVLVVQKSALRTLFTPDMTIDDFLIKNESNTLTIPYKSVSGYDEMKGFIPDKTEIDGKSVRICVGISEIKLGDNFVALLPNDLDERTE